jgi:hypothetical protein
MLMMSDPERLIDNNLIIYNISIKWVINCLLKLTTTNIEYKQINHSSVCLFLFKKI